MKRRDYIKSSAALVALTMSGCIERRRRPNVVFVFADQWRASATGYAGDPNVKTPHLDALARQSLNFKNAVSVCPVCGPARASILTGQYPLTNKFFVNDLCLNQTGPSIADVFNAGGYRTGYIGKWHLDGHGRSTFIPPDRRQGFEFFQALECSHNYNESPYYDNNDPELKEWAGYDAFDQTQSAIRFMRDNKNSPFMLFLAWGPPHGPYLTAPKKFRDLYDPATLELPDNVPLKDEQFAGVNPWGERVEMKGRERVREVMAGYYAHCSALDECVGMLQQSIRELGLEEDTVFVFTSDHGDMLGSHGLWKKQQPFNESTGIPFLMKLPGQAAQTIETPINLPDIMPTLCGLGGLSVPSSVQGRDWTPQIRHGGWPDEAALIANYQPFGQWPMAPHDEKWPLSRIGKEWRGVRTRRHTYVRDLNGPWLLFDNQRDPLQMNNLVGQPGVAELQVRLEEQLQQKLRLSGDDFKDGLTYIRRAGYHVDQAGTIVYGE
jgi:arylsulfatase A-like enzyme